MVKILEYNSTTEKDAVCTTSGDSVTNLEVLGSITFEGSTADDFETTFNVVDPTADRTITLPNISGTLPVLAVASTTQITATPEELNYSDGVTSNIQTQLDTKVNKGVCNRSGCRIRIILNSKIEENNYGSSKHKRNIKTILSKKLR